MVSAVHSGYEHDLTEIGFNGTQGIDSLAAGEWVSLSDTINNDVAKHLFADFRLNLGSLTTTSGDTVGLYLIPLLDGSTPSDWTDNVATEEEENEAHYVGSFSLSAGASAKISDLRSINLPPGKFQVGIRSNVTTNAFASSGNSLKYRSWDYASQ